MSDVVRYCDYCANRGKLVQVSNRGHCPGHGFEAPLPDPASGIALMLRIGIDDLRGRIKDAERQITLREKTLKEIEALEKDNG